jgi:[protein-PII] uridylyltransferase
MTRPQHGRNIRRVTLDDMRDVASFLASMPAEYRAAFDEHAQAEHAEIAGGRGERASIVATWNGDRDGATAICIVADDSPGLFSRISAALVAHDLDVVAAEAYCRRREDGTVEAVDLLWIRREAPLGARDIAAIGAMIDALVRGVVRFEAPYRPPRRIGGATRIRFEQHDGITVLTVEAADRPGLLLAMTKTIFLARMQIVGLHAKSERGRAVDRFQLAELDGGAVAQHRLLELQSAILEAIDAAHSGVALRASVP